MPEYVSGSTRHLLVLGGARSGKSRIAQNVAETSRARRIYVATAQALDDEMRDRIIRHQADRDESWQTREVCLELSEAIRTETGPDRVVLVDCLTLWLSNIFLQERDPDRSVEDVAQAIGEAHGPLILVSNEVGHGIVPDTSLGRIFRDIQGRLNQKVAQACDSVVFVTAGCPLLLKPAPLLDLKLS